MNRLGSGSLRRYWNFKITMKHKKGNPPALAVWLIKHIFPDDDRIYLTEDFEEIFRDLLKEKGQVSALCWCWGQFFTSLPLFIFRSIYWRTVMLKNYLKIAWRNVHKHKGYSLMNITGLAVGMACCFMIFLYVHHELSYDRYHKDSDRIYRIAMDIRAETDNRLFASISPMVAPALIDNYPQVEIAARVMPWRGVLVKRDNISFYEDRSMFADQELFDIFTIPFIVGNPQDALTRPMALVISQKMAHKYFGTENPLGKTLNINNQLDMEVTGVVADSPENTHLKYDLIVSLKLIERQPFMTNWHMTTAYTYLKLKPAADVDAFSRQVSRLADPFVGESLASAGRVYHYFLQPVPSIHLNSHLRFEIEASGNPVYLYIFSVVGLFILLIACLNFINLTTAWSVTRAREVGIRKVVGANRRQLINQFLGESMLMTLTALFIAIGLLRLSLPTINHLAGSVISFSILLNQTLLLVLFGVAVFVGLASGIYPAFVISRFKPVATVKGASLKGRRHPLLRSVLVAVQFSISIFLVIGTLVVYKQLNFMQNKHLGFDKEQKLVLPLRGALSINNNYETIKNEFLTQSSVTGVTFSSNVPGRGASNFNIRLLGEENDKSQDMFHWYFDDDFIAEYGIEIIAGRGFQKNMSTDVEGAFLINNAALKAFGWSTPEEAIGKRLETGNGGRVNPIIGVTADFHYRGLQQIVEPLIIEFLPGHFQYMTVSINTDNLDETLALVESQWKELFPANPYQSFFLDADFDSQYRSEKQAGQISGVFTFLGLFIACLGLLGLASFTAKQRTKEIGIRKVMGASVGRIAIMLGKEFVKWVLLSCIIACPIAYWAAEKWLHHFAYRMDLNAWIFILSCLAAVAISALTVSYQSVKAATANPVDSLRYE
jgi:putative ABC transport system permease protein